MSITQHRLAVDPSNRYKPFFNTTLVAHLGKLMKNAEIAENKKFAFMLNLARKLANRAQSLGVKSAAGKKTTYVARLDEIEKKVNETKNYALGSKLLFRETMRLMCAMRVPEALPKLRRIEDPNEAAELLHQSFRAMISNSTQEAKTLANLGIVISIGCGTWGEVFLEKYQGNDIETYIYTGLFADLLCSFINKYIADAPDGEEEADLMLAALLEVASLHPCAEKCAVFQAESLGTDDETLEIDE